MSNSSEAEDDERRRSVASLREVITSLFDAVRFSRQADALDEQARIITKEAEERLGRIDEFRKQLTWSLEDLVDAVDTPYATQLSAQLTAFVKAAIEQARVSAHDELKTTLAEVNSRALTERTKARRSLESFFATTPLPVVERVLTARLVGSRYEARSTYNCRGDVRYAFDLSTQASIVFGREFRFNRRLRIPVRLSKTWVRSEPSAKYERLDQFVLKYAEASDGHMIAEFEKEDDERSRLRMASSGLGGSAKGFTSVEYTDGSTTVNVTTDGGLAVYLDTRGLTAALYDIRSELLRLEGGRVALVELLLDWKSVLPTLDCVAVLQTVLEVMGPTYKAIVRDMSSGRRGARTDEITLSMIRERLSLLGPGFPAVRDILVVAGGGPAVDQASSTRD